jgi:hypothetical protein
LNFRHADERGVSERALEIKDALGLTAHGFRVTSGALTAGTKHSTSRADAQHASGGSRCLRAKLREHDLEHSAGDLVAVLWIVQRENHNVAGAFHDDLGGYYRLRRTSGFPRHAGTV